MPIPYARLGTIGVICLVALRLVIGWHFFMEGTTKVREGGFSSTGFLSAANGPFADYFHRLVPDYDGSIRIDDEAMKKNYDDLVKDSVSTFHLNAEQTAAAEKMAKSAESLLTDTYARWKPQIDEFHLGEPRKKMMENDPMRTRVESLRKQRVEIETKRKALIKPVLSTVDKITADLESELNALGKMVQLTERDALSEEAKKRAPALKTVKLHFEDEGPIDVGMVDKIIPIFDMSVGILLILGLLTPVAGTAAGLFLASIVLTQFPGWPGSQPTYYQAIEMVACFALAACDAGRYAGLDFLPWAFWNRNAGRKPAKQA